MSYFPEDIPYMTDDEMEEYGINAKRGRRMNKKYVIEIKPEYEDITRGIMVLGARDSNLYVDTLAVEDLEELNSDYVNEHFGDLQDEAYQRGHKEGYAKGFGEGTLTVGGDYQRGLNDAWECMKKIAFLEKPRDMRDFFGHTTFGGILTGYTANEAIEKLKAYEEKRKAADEIKVGDEVIYNNQKFIVFAPETEEQYASLFDVNGRHASASQRECQKTGKHVDIDRILEEMKA